MTKVENLRPDTIGANRCCVFAHFDKDDVVDDYVLHYLRSLGRVSSNIIFVSTSRLSADTLEQLKETCHVVIVRENIGHDFMSWQVGIHSLTAIDDYDELVICNDSVYGPFYGLEDIFSTMQGKSCDFWSLTENHGISYHLQSYFLVFRKAVLRSSEFRKFWESVHSVRPKQQIVQQFEVGLSQLLLQANFKPEVYIHYQPGIWSVVQNIDIPLMLKSPVAALRLLAKVLKTVSQRRSAIDRNPTHIAWKELIVRHKMPFIKIELLRDNPMYMDINDYYAVIRAYSDYDVNLICNHLARVKGLGQQ